MKKTPEKSGVSALVGVVIFNPVFDVLILARATAVPLSFATIHLVLRSLIRWK